MGAQWDKGVPSSTVWLEVLRVLKPGSSLLAFGGTRTFHRLTCAIEDAGFQIKDCLMWLHAQGFPKSKLSLKPAWEPIVLAIKSPEGSFIQNSATYGIAGLNIEGSRTDEGRWPANIILDESFSTNTWSRYFYCPKPSRVERDRGLDSFEAKDRRTMGCGLTGISGDRSGTSGASKSLEMGSSKVKNIHPCLKPLALNRYLANLILPPPRETPRRLLVPFSGSGSEMIGGLLAGWENVTGIEMEPEYVSIAEARILHWTQPSLAA
jgi:DNA modification methylase